MLPLTYPFKNVAARPGRSALTVLVIALVVVACSLFLGLLSSLRRTVVSTGNPLNLVVLRKGSDNDGSSQLSREAYLFVRYLPGVVRDAGGWPLASPELVVQPFFRTRAGGRDNVLVRGVEPTALQVHDDVRVVEGRFFRPRMHEAVVGRGVVGRYEGAALGQKLRFGRGEWDVVGVFESAGSSFESEVWVDVEDLGEDARRVFPYSGVRLRARDQAALVSMKRQIDADPRYAIEATPEPAYYEKQGEASNSLYVLVVAVAVLAGVGAGFGAANTMYAAVQARIAEIGTLRALGFSRGAILLSFQLEALALATLGFGLGALLSLGLAAALRALMGGIAFGATTFTTNVVTLSIGGRDLALSLGLALAIGLLGGLGPAWRAAHLRPIEALRRG
jgi:cell division protein FtsX